MPTLEGQELVVLAKVFAAEDADPLLGVTALEIFGNVAPTQ